MVRRALGEIDFNELHRYTCSRCGRTLQWQAGFNEGGQAVWEAECCQTDYMAVVTTVTLFQDPRH